MKAIFAPLMHAILALAVLVGTASTSSARLSHALLGQTGVQFVICSQDGARLIAIDADGNKMPTPSSNWCCHRPECALATIALLVRAVDLAPVAPPIQV